MQEKVTDKSQHSRYFFPEEEVRESHVPRQVEDISRSGRKFTYFKTQEVTASLQNSDSKIRTLGRYTEFVNAKVLTIDKKKEFFMNVLINN